MYAQRYLLFYYYFYAKTFIDYFISIRLTRALRKLQQYEPLRYYLSKADLNHINDMKNELSSRPTCIKSIYGLFAYEISRIIKEAAMIWTLLLQPTIKSSIFYHASSDNFLVGSITHNWSHDPKGLATFCISTQLNASLLLHSYNSSTPYGQFFFFVLVQNGHKNT